MMSPEVERPLPPYLQVLTRIRQQILSGELAPGDRVPSERQICDEWGVSRATATKVLGGLRYEGLVTSTQGVGTTVKARVLQGGGDRMRRLRASGTLYRKDEKVTITSADLVTAPDYVADALGLEAGSDVIRRTRSVSDTQGVAATSTSWLPGSLTETSPLLLTTERIGEGGTVRYVEETAGRRVVRGRDALTSRLAAPEEAQLLGLTSPAAVLVAQTVLWDQNGEVVEFGEDVSPAGRIWSTEFDM